MNILSQIRSSSRLWRLYLNGPLFIPEQGHQVIEILELKGPDALIAELERLASLGSPWAAAALGYICLRPMSDGKRRADRAIELCKTHAERGNGYALFVLGWALLHNDNKVGAIRAMKKAALAGFPPAMLDYAKFAWNGWGTRDIYPSVSLVLLRRADEAHHRAALLTRCTFYRSGKFGILFKLIGYLATPYAFMRLALALLRDPFSCRVFSFQESTAGPLFRTPKRS